jgi:hypothetical protein
LKNVQILIIFNIEKCSKSQNLKISKYLKFKKVESLGCKKFKKLKNYGKLKTGKQSEETQKNRKKN